MKIGKEFYIHKMPVFCDFTKFELKNTKFRSNKMLFSLPGELLLELKFQNDFQRSKDSVTHPLMSEDSDDQSSDDLSFNGNQVRKCGPGEDRKPSQANKREERRRQPPGYTPRRFQVLSDTPMPYSNLRFMAHQFRYLVGTRHSDDEEGDE